ncbi:MAG: pyrroline-5-carboxylate reductase [Lachnospiraceae bacterium]|nr:pyrroline-5-carboxylate reductase [Lachnospiraceae bacterium]
MSLITFIGCGNMGLGMLTALTKNEAIKGEDIVVSEPDKDRLNQVVSDFGVQGIADNKEAVKASKYILLAVKPQVLPLVMDTIAPTLKECTEKGEEKILVSIAAGTPIERIRELSGLSSEKLPIVRIFPNLPAAIGEGLLFFSTADETSEKYTDELMEMFKHAGLLEKMPESGLEIAGVIGGCVPAYAYMFVEAMADGAVSCGMPRAQAIRFAAQAVKGACGLVLTSGKHPEQLKDEVCSPAGTTICGVKALEENGFRNAAIQSIVKPFEKSQQLSKK